MLATLVAAEQAHAATQSGSKAGSARQAVPIIEVSANAGMLTEIGFQPDQSTDAAAPAVRYDSMTVQAVSPVPEPAAFPMMAIGILIIWRALRRRRNAQFKI